MDLTSSDKNWRRKFETLAQKEREDYKVVMVWSKVGLENYRNYFFEYFRPHIQEDNSQISILDVGCGPGMYVSLLAQKGFQIHGVDYSEEMIAMAKKRVSGDNVRFSVADVYHLPFSDDSFDIVLCLGLFQSVDDCERGLREVKRVLKSDGVVIITTLNSFSLGSLLFRGNLGSTISWRRYNPYSFKKKLSSVGFTQLKLGGIYFAPQPVYFLSRIILKSGMYKLMNLLFPLFLLFSNSVSIEGKKKSK